MAISYTRFLYLCVVIGCLFAPVSCSKGLQTQTQVYQNDFENNTEPDITGGRIFSYNRTKVLGRYNNAGFKLNLNDLPDHDLVKITFDLYIHDSWDGNSTVGGGVGGPDIWELSVDGAEYISTTFSNLPCPQTCSPQSYPRNYSNNNTNPRTGASQVDLPAVCTPLEEGGGTSVYKISKTVEHSKNALILECIDRLKQDNTADKLCDESWSVDNLTIDVIKLN